MSAEILGSIKKQPVKALKSMENQWNFSFYMTRSMYSIYEYTIGLLI
jgi:hypothetical protein